MPNPWADPRPFDLGARSAEVVFVLLHGFTGAPAEMRPLAEALAERGHRCVGPQLPGHGSTPVALRGVVWEDWAEAAEQAVGWVEGQHDRIVLGGLSMGGLLTTVLVGEHRVDVDAAVLLAPAFEVSDPLFRFARLGKLLLNSIPAPPLPRSGLTSEDGWKRLWHYDDRPTEAIWQLRRLQQHALGCLKGIDVPTLIAQGRKDLTLVPDGAKRAAAKVRDVELMWLPESGHCLTADVELDLVLDGVSRLIERMPAHDASTATR